MGKIRILILSSLVIITIAIIIRTNIRHHIYTLIQAASRMKTSHDDYKIFPKIILEGNESLKDIPRQLISYDKKNMISKKNSI